MALNPRCKGKVYGPFVYQLGLEKMREFANAVYGGGAPWPNPSSTVHPFLTDEAEAARGPYGAVIAFPTFAAVFAIAPFFAAVSDEELNANPLMLVHGEQEFEFFEVMRAGDTMTTTGALTDIYPKGGLEFLVVTTESKNQHDRLAVRGTWTAIIRS
jgi:acyl dehydratase